MSTDAPPNGRTARASSTRDVATAATSTERLGEGAAVLAFDVGGTDIKAALFDESGRLCAHIKVPTPLDRADPARAVIDRLHDAADRLVTVAPDVTPRAAGLIVPGIVDPVDGVGVFASNLGWRDAPLRRLASERLRLPVAFEHDVRAAGLAEHRLGRASAHGDLVMLVIGTGIAGAIILDGHPYAAGGFAGEIGHSPIAEQPACPCGARGCLEAIASASAIARGYEQRTGRSVTGAKEVLEARRAGDIDAAQVWDEALDGLARAIAQLTAVLAPHAVIIGGGLSRAGDELFAPLRERVRERLSFHRVPAILPAALHDRAGMLGAALLARDLIAAE